MSPIRPREEEDDGPQPPPAKSLRLTSLATIDSTTPLPDEILVSILGRLTLRDAVRSRTVSRRWRDAVVSSILQSDKLVFNAANMLRLSRLFSCNSHGERKCFAKRKKKFVAAVNQFLLFLSNHRYICHNKLCTRISSFRVEFCLSSSYSHDIDRWVDYAIKVLGVRKVCLNLQCRAVCKRNRDNYLAIQEKRDKFVISSRCCSKIFYCNLDELTLSACRLKPNLFGLQQEQFSGSLKTLKLFNVPLAEHNIESMFRYLPKVETLYFDQCSLPKKLCLDSLEALKALTVFCCPNIKVIQISNNLKLSRCICRGSRKIQCDLSGARNLEMLRALFDARAVDCLFSSGSKNFPMLYDLSIIIPWKADGLDCISDHMPIWGSITKLALNLPLRKPFVVTKMISIITALPSLRKLGVQMDFDDLLPTDSVETGNYSIPNLEVVEFRTSHVTTNLLWFATYLAKHAISLKRSIFQRAFCLEPWEKGAVEKVSELQKRFMGKSFVLCPVPK